MNKRFRNILILSLAVLAAAGANICLKLYTANNQLDAADETSQGMYISNYSVGTVEKIEIENQYGEIVLVQENDVWYVQGEETAELDQGVVSEMAYMMTHILAERTVSETEDTENVYGMAAPSAIITTYHKDMVEQKFIIGNKSPIDNQYYLQSSVFKKVYTVDMVYYIYGNVKLEDLLLIKGVEIEHADMKEIKIKNSLGEEFTIRRTLPENDISLCYWEFIEPFNHDIDTAVMYGSEKYSGMITTIVELTGDKVIDIDGRQRQTYGLDNPIFTAEILSSSGYLQSFAIGEYGDEDNYSLKFSNDINIYSISKDTVAFVDYSAYIMADANLDLINIDTVDSIIIDLPGVGANMGIEHFAIKNQDGTNALDADGSEIWDIIISVDNLDENTLNVSNIAQQKLWMYQEIVTIKIDDLLINDIETGERVGSIVFTLNSEYKSNFTVDFYEYSNSHYIAKKNGEEAAYLVNKKEINELAEKYALLLDGKLESDY